jgi:endonuclease/exonuclease/phosphatase family metal-dependent hydrolase
MRTASSQEADNPRSVMRAGGTQPPRVSVQPRLTRAPTEDPPLKVASYNIHLGIGRDGRFAPERIAAIVKELDADIVCLQEVSLGHPGFDMLTFLSRACRMHGIAGPTLTTSRGDYGNAILTRLDPIEVRRWDLSVPGHEPRGAISMVVKIAGFRWRAIATHLGLRPGERRKQIRRLLGFMQEAGSLPTVLMGDVNEWFLWGRPLRWLHRHFKRTPAPATFPSGWPIFALDRIWVEPNSALHGVRVHRSELSAVGSDHLPLTAQVRLDADGGVSSVKPA